MSGGEHGLGFGTVYRPEPEPGTNGPAIPPARLRELPRRRRPAMIALAAALVGAGILASAVLYQRADHQVPVLLVKQEVPAGSVITASDIGTTTIAAGPGVQVIPARQEAQVLGLVAATSLQPGTLLAASELTSRLAPGPGQELVPVALKPSQLPASGLAPGDQVLAVPTPGSGSSSAAPALSAPIPAVVEAVNANTDSDGFDVVDLLVASGNGPALAQQAANDEIALVVTHRTAP
jgi:SAF domain-containing protein